MQKAMGFSMDLVLPRLVDVGSMSLTLITFFNVLLGGFLHARPPVTLC